MPEQYEAVTVGVRRRRVIEDDGLAVDVLRQLVEVVEVGISRPGAFRRGRLAVAQPVEHLLAGDDGGRGAQLAHRTPEPAGAAGALEVGCGRNLLVATGVLGRRAGIEDEAHALWRPWRRDERVEVRARPGRLP